MAIGVPSVTASTLSPAPTTAGIPDDRASTAACDVGAAGGRHDARAPSPGSSPTVSAGDRSRAITTPGASSSGPGNGRPRRCASTCRPTLRRSAARARRYSSSSASHPRGRPLDHVVPGPGGRTPVVGDRAPGAGSGARRPSGRAGARRRSRPRPRSAIPATCVALTCDLVADAVERGVERGASPRRRPPRRRRGSAGRASGSASRGTDRDPGRGGMAADESRRRPGRRAPAAAAGGARVGSGRSSKSRSARRLDRGQRLGRLRSGRRDLDLVALRRPEHRHAVQARGVRRTAAVRQVADRDPRIERRRRLDEARRRPRVEAVRRVRRSSRDRRLAPASVAADGGDLRSAPVSPGARSSRPARRAPPARRDRATRRASP